MHQLDEYNNTHYITLFHTLIYTFSKSAPHYILRESTLYTLYVYTCFILYTFTKFYPLYFYKVYYLYIFINIFTF